MNINVDIEPHEGYIVAKYTGGPGSPEVSRAFMEKAIEACNKFKTLSPRKICNSSTSKQSSTKLLITGIQKSLES